MLSTCGLLQGYNYENDRLSALKTCTYYNIRQSLMNALRSEPKNTMGANGKHRNRGTGEEHLVLEGVRNPQRRDWSFEG